MAQLPPSPQPSSLILSSARPLQFIPPLLDHFDFPSTHAVRMVRLALPAVLLGLASAVFAAAVPNTVAGNDVEFIAARCVLPCLTLWSLHSDAPKLQRCLREECCQL